MTDPTDAQPLSEEQATDLVWQAVERAGGTRSIYRNPRMAFAFNAKREFEIDGHEIEIRYGEISTPAVATVDGAGRVDGWATGTVKINAEVLESGAADTVSVPVTPPASPSITCTPP